MTFVPAAIEVTCHACGRTTGAPITHGWHHDASSGCWCCPKCSPPETNTKETDR